MVRGRVPFLANGDPSLDEELKAKAKHTRCLAEMIGVSAAVECWAGSSGPVDHHGHWPWPLRFLCLFSASPSRSLAFALLALCCTSSQNQWLFRVQRNCQPLVSSAGCREG